MPNSNVRWKVRRTLHHLVLDHASQLNASQLNASQFYGSQLNANQSNASQLNASHWWSVTGVLNYPEGPLRVPVDTYHLMQHSQNFGAVAEMSVAGAGNRFAWIVRNVIRKEF